jgi:hypothetical protein
MGQPTLARRRDAHRFSGAPFPEMMSHIRAKGTKPKLIVCSLAHWLPSQPHFVAHFIARKNRRKYKYLK